MVKGHYAWKWHTQGKKCYVTTAVDICLYSNFHAIYLCQDSHFRQSTWANHCFGCIVQREIFKGLVFAFDQQSVKFKATKRHIFMHVHTDMINYIHEY